MNNPLDHLVTDGGLCSVFKTVGCIGDSLSTGEFETTLPNGAVGYYDDHYYSWIQFMARKCGFTAYNFTRGGLTTKEFNDFYRFDCGFEDSDKRCQAYVVALGVNDLYCGYEPGSLADVDLEHPENNPHTFAGEYGKMLTRIKQIQPKCRLFLVTAPRSSFHVNYDSSPEHTAWLDRHAELLYEFAALFPFTYVLDLRRYAPVCDDAFAARYCIGAHLNSLGYRLMADYIATLMDDVIRRNEKDFAQVCFIGTPHHNDNAVW